MGFWFMIWGLGLGVREVWVVIGMGEETVPVLMTT